MPRDCVTCTLMWTVTCPHLQTTRLQPPFFSTWFWHLGQGLVLVFSQFAVSLSSLHLRCHCFHLRFIASTALPSGHAVHTHIKPQMLCMLHCADDNALMSADCRGTVTAASGSFVNGISLPNAATFSENYNQLTSLLWASIYNTVNPIYNAKMWTGTSQTSNKGTATFYPTSSSTVVDACVWAGDLHVAGARGMGVQAALKAELEAALAHRLALQITINL